MMSGFTIDSVFHEFKAVIQVLCIHDFLAVPHLRILVMMKQILVKRRSHACLETHVRRKMMVKMIKSYLDSLEGAG